MTEIENRNRTKLKLQTEKYQQLELLFEIYNLKNVREKLRKKLESIEKMIKRDCERNLTNRIEAMKVISTENNDRFKEVMSKLKSSYNIFKLVEELDKNNQYLANLNKERKRGRVDMEQYEITKGYYLQKVIDIYESVNQLKDLTITYYHELKDELIMFEDQRIKLTTEKLRKMITKKEFNQKSNEIESLKHQLEEKLAFFEIEIIDLELE
ncbi:MAG: hypothetical protein CEE43_06650 [Promethearchaeota archaeon Loki_b32]|nr:MAG: hypothetical protein CEE43_06650 [Candidatus Lokiarchaeota archaeon Loki_b32]